MNNFIEIWEECQNILRKSTNSVIYFNYIKCIHPISCNEDAGQFMLEIPGDSRQNVIKGRYKETIKMALEEVMGRPMEVTFCLPGGILDTEVEEDLELYKNNGINSAYTFDNFIVGDNNQMAFTAALNVAEIPGKLHNPLFIYGAPGLGKTHLMHSIGNHILQRDLNSKVIYVTSEGFTNDYITSLQMKNMDNFRNKYRKCNLLLIDDIQFLTKKKETQEEFHHTFNELMENNSQIVISSDRPPREIRDLEERLYSRFSMGLMADISAPELETRIAILQEKLHSKNIDIPQEVIYYIAETITSNIRDLEGSIQRVTAYAKLKNVPVTLAVAKEAFKGLYGHVPKSVLTPDKIKFCVCEYMNIDLSELESKKRSKNIVIPRQISQYLMYSVSGMSYSDIGKIFGNDHSTIMSNCEKIEMLIKTDDNIRNSVKDLKSMLIK